MALNLGRLASRLRVISSPTFWQSGRRGRKARTPGSFPLVTLRRKAGISLPRILIARKDTSIDRLWNWCKVSKPRKSGYSNCSRNWKPCSLRVTMARHDRQQVEKSAIDYAGLRDGIGQIHQACVTQAARAV